MGLLPFLYNRTLHCTIIQTLRGMPMAPLRKIVTIVTVRQRKSLASQTLYIKIILCYIR